MQSSHIQLVYNLWGHNWGHINVLLFIEILSIVLELINEFFPQSIIAIM